MFKCGIKAARKSRIVGNTNDRRYELETEENIKYMLSNNFMFFCFYCDVVVSSIGAYYRVSGKYDWDASKIIISVFVGRLCVTVVVSCVILETHAVHSSTIWVHVECWYWLSNNRISCRRLPLHRRGWIVNHRYYQNAVRTVRHVRIRPSSPLPTMNKCKIRTSTHQTLAGQEHIAFCIILEMNSTSIEQWST